VGMEFFGFAVTFLAAVLAVVGWWNARSMRRLVEAIREDGRRRHEEAVALINGHHADVVALMNRHHEDAVTLLQAIREQMARQHEDAMALLRAIRETVEAVRADIREMDRRHTELMERLADLIAAEGERTRRALGGGAA